MRKLKILNIGNVDSFKNNYICQYFIGRGHEVHFIGRSKPVKPVEGMHYHTIETKILKIPKLQLLELICRAKSIIKRVRPDVIHAHTAGNPALYARFSGFHPFVIQCFGGDLFDVRNKFYEFMTRLGLQKADYLIVTGKHMIDILENVYHADRTKIEFLPRGLDLTIFKPYENQKDFRQKYGLASGPIILSPRYQLDKVYNIEVIIRSVPLVKKAFPEIQYVQLLKEPENRSVYDDCIDLIDRLGIKSNFRFIPSVENKLMPDFYNAADVCVSIPNYDGFPVSVLEGAACGVPFIVSDVPYTHEWFENGKNGIILDRISEEALANATIRLLNDEAMRKEMVAINMEKVRKGFDYVKCMERLEQIYYGIIN